MTAKITQWKNVKDDNFQNSIKAQNLTEAQPSQSVDQTQMQTFG